MYLHIYMIYVLATDGKGLDGMYHLENVILLIRLTYSSL